MQVDTAEQEAVFDIVPDVVFFAKDREGRLIPEPERTVPRMTARISARTMIPPGCDVAGALLAPGPWASSRTHA